jgi:predicted cupin superfamily sugar epimerase
VHPRAQHLIHTLGLAVHPEGGAFREVFRSARRVTGEGRSRPALTTIYFLLAERQHSRWHRIAHDEAWHFYEGDPLELWWIAPDFSSLERRRLAPLPGDGTAAPPGGPAPASAPVTVVPAGCWQAARCLGAYSLVGCTVGPGFEFEDFALMSDRPAEAERLRVRFPGAAALV